MHQENRFKIALITGGALFAMFFGAGNMVFPLQVGAEAGSHVWTGIFFYLLTGVGVSFLGLFSVALYKGDYWHFFGVLGRFPAFLIITFLILIIGPAFAAPRTEVVTYDTFLPFLPGILRNPWVFSIGYFLVIYAYVANRLGVVDFIGRFLSPTKLCVFLTLIVLGVFAEHTHVLNDNPAWHRVAVDATLAGYNTMDMLGAFFYCGVAYRSITHKSDPHGNATERVLLRVLLRACVIAAIFLSVIYIGFALTANYQAALLQNVDTGALVGAISQVVMGKFGAFFVCICVFLACTATAAALAEVSTVYFHEMVFQSRIPKHVCLIAVLMAMVGMSILGFDGIMRIAGPILTYLYPALIVLSIFNLFRGYKELRQREIEALKEAHAHHL
ncbi:MAG: hypothetical protein A3J38_03080 [Gammaproteobacteria bacterium RIFCSPHIGHO2_12_FULL_45_9]|nr:MAG: hypothetical protein A3J38_03080 [Gammaproteobacteria bacterium RIFCSPHIGHO2_12_FULL_45_9]